MRTQGIVTDLFLCEEKGSPPRPAEELHLLAGLGVEGDIHAKGGPRQVSMLSGEAAEWMEQQQEAGLCFKRYQANLRVEGLSFSSLIPGTRLSVGTSVLVVSESGKECFANCVLYLGGEGCKLSGGGLFFIVEGTGIIRKDDKIVIIA